MTSNLSYNTWYHVVAVYTGTQLKIYVNGVQNGASVNSTGSMTTNTKSVFIGGDPEFPANTRARWKGDLDDVYIFNRALSDTEITTLYGLGH